MLMLLYLLLLLLLPCCLRACPNLTCVFPFHWHRTAASAVAQKREWISDILDYNWWVVAVGRKKGWV